MNATAKSPRVPRFSLITSTVSSVVSDACSEIESLQDEMQSWYDNMPENLQGGDKGSAVSDAADTLSNVQEPDVPEALSDLAVTYQHDRKANSRSARAGQCCAMLQAASDALTAHRDTMLDETLEGTNDKRYDEADEEISAIDDLISEIDEIVSEVEGVEFPGMFG